jgi:hypothetical protein
MTKDPRIPIVTGIMKAARSERARRMIEVRDMRKKEGRFTLEQEAEQIINTLDKYAENRAAETLSK